VVNSDLNAVSKFMQNNKYVVEAVFENVLVDSQMLNQRFASFNEGEKKVLFEAMLLNDEFKEYLYQKIAKEEIGRALNRVDGDLMVSHTDGFREDTTTYKGGDTEYNRESEDK
jgi:uncharacterized protein (UPF0212 family)